MKEKHNSLKMKIRSRMLNQMLYKRIVETIMTIEIPEHFIKSLTKDI
jgi:hypothetical protein